MQPQNESEVTSVNGQVGDVSLAFTDLTDTPAAYTGQGGKVVAVKADVSGLEFIAQTSTDEKVMYAADDASAGYLGAKTVAGTGISLAEGTAGNADKLVITNSAPDQTVAISAGTNITSVTGTYPNFTINAATQTTDITGKANLALDNLASVAMNAPLQWNNSADRTFDIANTATDVVGRALTIKGGSTAASTSNDSVAGGKLNLAAGLGSGQGESSIVFKTGYIANKKNFTNIN